MEKMHRVRVMFSDESFDLIRSDLLKLCDELFVSNTTLFRLAIEHCLGIETFGKIISRSHDKNSVSCLISKDDIEKFPILNKEKAMLLRKTITDYRSGEISKDLLKKIIPHI